MKNNFLNRYFNRKSLTSKRIKIPIVLVVLISIVFVPFWVGIALISALLCYLLYVDFSNTFKLKKMELKDLDSFMKSPNYYLGTLLIGIISFCISVVGIVLLLSNLDFLKDYDLNFESVFILLLIILFIFLIILVLFMIGWLGIRAVLLSIILIPISKTYELFKFALKITPSSWEILNENRKKGINEDIEVVNYKSFGNGIVSQEMYKWFISVREDIEYQKRLERSSFFSK